MVSLAASASRRLLMGGAIVLGGAAYAEHCKTARLPVDEQPHIGFGPATSLRASEGIEQAAGVLRGKPKMKRLVV
jgi:hypothetical protein